eukprot:scaffold2404_cov398-Prasinococcus_capsulatus_cf.AAC.14
MPSSTSRAAAQVHSLDISLAAFSSKLSPLLSALLPWGQASRHLLSAAEGAFNDGTADAVLLKGDMSPRMAAAHGTPCRGAPVPGSGAANTDERGS